MWLRSSNELCSVVVHRPSLERFMNILKILSWRGWICGNVLSGDNGLEFALLAFSLNFREVFEQKYETKDKRMLKWSKSYKKTYILFHFQQFLHIYNISPLRSSPPVCPLFIFAFVQDFVCLRVCGGTLVLYRSMSPLHQLSLVDPFSGGCSF